MIKLSVIIPVYNVEKYIYECIESLINQSIKEIEIIVIDDGSKDSSIEIVKKFNDKRINIITKANGGISSARNKGIEIARGKYICFVDSDDFIGTSSALEEMYDIALQDDSDIVVGNSIRCYPSGRFENVRRDKEIFKRDCLSRDEFLIKFRKRHCMYSAVWTNMYRTKLLLDNNLKFKEGILHEDEDFTPRVFLKANKISIYPKAFYMYRIREGSIMTTKNIKKAIDIINICISLQEELDKINNKEVKKLMAEYEVQLILNTSYENKMENISKEAKMFVLKNAYSNKLKVHALLYSINPKLYYKFIDMKN